MKSSKRNIASFVVFAVFISCVSLLYVSTYTHASSFMDLELSIKEMKQLVEKSSPSLVRVIAYDDCGQESGSGSGFFIDSKGTIITNASVIKGAYSAEVLSRSGQNDNVIILHKDDSIDFALIQVNSINERPLELAFDYEARPGERIVVTGISPDLKKTVSEGLIISIEDKSKLMSIQTTKPLLAYRESKDGPLLNMSGNVIGIMSTTFLDSEEADGISRMPDYENFKALNISAVKGVVSRSESSEQLHPAKSIIWSRWIMRWMQTAAISTFIFFYGVGFPKLIAFAFLSILAISVIQWLFIKLKRTH